MALQFCPVCRNLLMLKEIDGKMWSVCNCGFKRPSAIDLSVVEKDVGKLTKTGEGVINDDRESVEKMTYEDRKERKAEY